MNINFRNAAMSIAKKAAVGGLVTLLLAPGVYADDFDSRDDFGALVEKLLNRQSDKYFGIENPLKDSAPETTGPYRATDQKASDQVLLAKGLQLEYLTREAANNADMMAFFPADKPTHRIYCVESQNTPAPDNGKMNPSVQRVDLETGKVETILRGMSRCDGTRSTPWGTILVTEEQDDGSAYEIFDPLTTTEVTIGLRNICGEPATILDSPGSNNVIKRTALPCMAWEGLAVLPSGVVIGGDELRPGTGTDDADGGAIFKFVPTVLRTQTGPIANLNESPLSADMSFAIKYLASMTPSNSARAAKLATQRGSK
jgi:hypothetical protein